MFLTPTSGGVLTAPSGNRYSLSRNTNVVRNGLQMGGTSGTSLLTHVPNVIVRQIASTKTWEAYDGVRWRAVVPPVPTRPDHSLSAPTQTTLTVTITEVANADGYKVEWRKKGDTAWRPAM